MDQSPSFPPLTTMQAIRSRLVGYGPFIIGLAGIILGFVLLGNLPVWFGALGFVLAVVILAVLPLPVVTLTQTVEVPVQVPPNDKSAISAFAEALADPCFVLDRRSTVLFSNAAATNQYPNLLVGRVMTLVLRNPELVATIDAVLRSGEAHGFELHETLPSETWDKVLVAPLKQQGRNWLEDENRQVLVTFQSLTELKRVDAMRADFIANASHELRTPLASLIGFIDTLLGPAAKDAAAREKFLGIMRAQADRMSRLIDDMLSLSRIEMHQHVRPTGSVDLAALLREVREGLQTQARAAELDVILTLPGHPVTVSGDRGQLYEVFENLIDNAIKYGANGKSVEVTLAEINRAGLHHMVSVVDHGPGVEPEHVPRMTERFYRIDAETSRKKKGTGLGLAIVKHIIQRHRGQMAIKSAPGEGLRVDVLLP